MPPDRDLVASLQSEICPACAGLKKPRQTLCSRDYCRLPKAMRNKLYNRLGDGYGEAVVGAMDWLGKSEFRLTVSPAGMPKTTPAPGSVSQMTMFPNGPREGMR